jgi:hypothetical protein
MGSVGPGVLVVLRTGHFAVGQPVAAARALGPLVIELGAAHRAAARVDAGTARALTATMGALHGGVLH